MSDRISSRMVAHVQCGYDYSCFVIAIVVDVTIVVVEVVEIDGGDNFVISVLRQISIRWAINVRLRRMGCRSSSGANVSFTATRNLHSMK